METDLDQPIVKTFAPGTRVLITTRWDVYAGQVGTVQGTSFVGWHDVLFTDDPQPHPYADWELADATL